MKKLIAIDRTAKYIPRSPHANMIGGAVFGLLDYFLFDYSIKHALAAGAFFGLVMSFADYCYVYYKQKEV